MKKIKLPRKRKKEFIKVLGKSNYLAFQILNEVLNKTNFPLYDKNKFDRFGKNILIKNF